MSVASWGYSSVCRYPISLRTNGLAFIMPVCPFTRGVSLWLVRRMVSELFGFGGAALPLKHCFSYFSIQPDLKCVGSPYSITIFVAVVCDQWPR